MISMRLPLALACALFVLPVATVANAAGQTAEKPPASEEPAEQSADDAAEDAVTEEKRICRYVKLDTSSRRKTKVCRTSEEWRELNNPR